MRYSKKEILKPFKKLVKEGKLKKSGGKKNAEYRLPE